MQIDDRLRRPAPVPKGGPLWTLGMRPFYLCAGIYAAVAVLMWVASFAGIGTSPIHDPLWHAHEMIFGYALAVVTGFLFTAVRNWTQRPTPTGLHLAATVGLWLMARLLLWISPALSAIADLAFALTVIHGIGRPILHVRQWKNISFVLVVTGIGIVNGLFHLSMAGALELSASHLLQTALDLVLFVMAVMGGRVIPSFTANVIGLPARRNVWVEQVSLGAILALLAGDVFGLRGMPMAATALIALVAHAIRFILWRPLKTRGAPLLWILHGAYFWVLVHFALRALAAIGLVSNGLAIHALTVGGLGALTLGMMTRTARGHLGWPLKAGKTEVTAYALIFSAAAVRVLLPIAVPGHYVMELVVSGLLWAAAFALFTLRYWPILTGPNQR